MKENEYETNKQIMATSLIFTENESCEPDISFLLLAAFEFSSSLLVYRLGYGPFKAGSGVRFPDRELSFLVFAFAEHTDFGELGDAC